MIGVGTSGSWDKSIATLHKMAKINIADIMRAGGQKGVNALSKATPVDSSLAAHSWTYEVKSSGGIHTLTWYNTDVENGFPVAIMLQYGYSTGTGGWVSGYDYINPAIRPIFDDIADRVWKAVVAA
jgi:hypothetical protein